MTTPTYNPNIPLPLTTIAEAQTLFLNNFSTLFDAFGLNHVALNDPSNPGNHTVIQLLEQEKSRSTQSQEIAIYSKKVPGQTDQIFMRYPNNGKEFQLTEYQIYSITPTPQQEQYFSFLPGKIIVYFGRVFSAGTTSFNINITPPTKNVTGVNVACIGSVKAQPNVDIQQPSEGFYRQIILKSQSGMVDNFYLFFGNL